MITEFDSDLATARNNFPELTTYEALMVTLAYQHLEKLETIERKISSIEDDISEIRKDVDSINESRS